MRTKTSCSYKELYINKSSKTNTRTPTLWTKTMNNHLSQKILSSLLSHRNFTITHLILAKIILPKIILSKIILPKIIRLIIKITIQLHNIQQNKTPLFSLNVWWTKSRKTTRVLSKLNPAKLSNAHKTANKLPSSYVLTYLTSIKLLLPKNSREPEVTLSSNSLITI